jgi:general secretion pathway protein J
VSAVRRSRALVVRGMTLVEVLVALVLLSMLSVGLISSFRIGQRSYAGVLSLDRSHREVVSTQRFLRQALESAYPFEPDAQHRGHGLEGSVDRLSLTAPMGLAQGSAGYRRYSFSLVHRRAGPLSDLVGTAEVDRNGGALAEGLPVFTETLIPDIQGVEWSYFSSLDGIGWRSDWAERRPPALVRLRVIFPPRDPRRWPELIVAPRITEDANCDFDVIAQACREKPP